MLIRLAIVYIFGLFSYLFTSIISPPPPPHLLLLLQDSTLALEFRVQLQGQRGVLNLTRLCYVMLCCAMSWSAADEDEMVDA